MHVQRIVIGSVYSLHVRTECVCVLKTKYIIKIVSRRTHNNVCARARALTEQAEEGEE